MWKASFTAVLSVKKKPPLRNYNFLNLEGLLNAGVTIGVIRSTSYEGNFRFATSGAFASAWKVMENNEKSFVEDRKHGITTMLKNDYFAFFDSLTAMAGTEAYQTCQLSPIPTKCVLSEV